MNTFVTITLIVFKSIVSLPCANNPRIPTNFQPFFWKKTWLRAKIYNHAFRWVTYDEESLNWLRWSFERYQCIPTPRHLHYCLKHEGMLLPYPHPTKLSPLSIKSCLIFQSVYIFQKSSSFFFIYNIIWWKRIIYLDTNKL